MLGIKEKNSGLTALLLPAIEDGYVLKSCLEMMAHRKDVLIRRRVFSKEEGELARGQGCNPGYGHQNPNAGIVAPVMQCSVFLSTHEELRTRIRTLCLLWGNHHACMFSGHLMAICYVPFLRIRHVFIM